MAEVIDFPKTNVLMPLSYLMMARDVLTDDDYLDFLEACTDPEAYKDLDEQMKDIVDAYMNS